MRSEVTVFIVLALWTIVTIVLAHKGLSSVAPENTVSAFESALAAGADGFETDIQMTRDCVPVCSHGYTAEAACGGKRPIHELSLEELNGHNPKRVGGRIATLEECLHATGTQGIANLELKTPYIRRREYVEGIASRLKDFGVGRRAIVTSFDHSLVRDIQHMDAGCGTGVLMLPVIDDFEEIIDIIGECYPRDKPMDALTMDDVSPLEDSTIIQDVLGIDGASPGEVYLGLGRTLGRIYPGETFVSISKRIMSQADVPSYVDGLDFKPDYVFCHYLSCFTEPDTISSIHDRGMKAFAWTVDNPRYAERLREMGVDGFISNEPAVLIKAISCNQNRTQCSS